MAIAYRSNTSKLNDFLEDSRNKSLFTGAITVIFVVIMVLIGILPAYSSLSGQVLENNKRDEAIKKLEDKLSQIKLLNSEKQNKTDLVNYLTKIFPDRVDQEGVIDILFPLAIENDIDITNITFSVSTETNQNIDPRVRSESVVISLEGQKNNILKYIQVIENSKRIINIKSLSIIKKSNLEISKDTKGNQFKASLSLIYYYFQVNETT